jgi:hypothetical protein
VGAELGLRADDADAEIAAHGEAAEAGGQPDLCAIAEVDGEPVGFALGLPDYNMALRHVNGGCSRSASSSCSGTAPHRHGAHHHAGRQARLPAAASTRC